MNNKLDLIATPLLGVTVIQRKPMGDERGFFERMFCGDELRAAKIEMPIAQINRTLTKQKGSVRGMHFQIPPHAEIKIVSCLKGRIFDVAVDLRRTSVTFLHWHAEELSADNHKSLLIDKGFAHGFQALSDDCELLYFHSASYAPSAEGGINPSDARVGITWPLPIATMSPRDRGFPALTNDFAGIML